jgi:hypothetical protein
LYDTILGRQRSYKQAGTDYTASVNSRKAARDLFLGQLKDAYLKRGNDLAADLASRGLAGSGIALEEQANLGKQQQSEQSQYDLGYQGDLAKYRQSLDTTRAGLIDANRRSRLRFQRLRSDRARILKLMAQ